MLLFMKRRIGMRINEIFYSLQGEGQFTGTPAIFIRFAGCNLNCAFCDTNHHPHKDYTEDEIIGEITKLGQTEYVVLTGGEPTMQITSSFLRKLKECGKTILLETNGTKSIREDLLPYISWITCSPKFEFCKNAEINIPRIDELKIVYDGTNDMERYEKIAEDWLTMSRYIQPCDTQDVKKNKEIVDKCVEFCLQHPKWKLSLQTQKILNVR